MAWFDSAADKVRELAGIASQKTSDAVEISRLKMQASQVNSVIRSTYERIGTLIYDQEKSGVDNSDIVTICISEIDTLLFDLSKINEKIAGIKNGAVCPNCGSANHVKADYCSTCGSSLLNPKKSGSDDNFASSSFVVNDVEDEEPEQVVYKEEVPVNISAAQEDSAEDNE